MKKLLTLIFCICIIFSSFTFAGSFATPTVDETSQARFSDPFAKVGSWIKNLFKRKPKIIVCYTADVNNITLSQTEITSDGIKEIVVSTEAYDHEGDTLLYVYKISGGEIIGEGSKVTWNLSGVAPGSYIITVGVDDGAGVVGKTVTKTVKVLEMPGS